jgi:predicted DNA-binding protein
MRTVTEPVSARLPDALRCSIEKLARRQGVTRATYIRRALELVVEAELMCKETRK